MKMDREITKNTKQKTKHLTANEAVCRNAGRSSQKVLYKFASFSPERTAMSRRPTPSRRPLAASGRENRENLNATRQEIPNQ
jgi:hypothetical protein